MLRRLQRARASYNDAGTRDMNTTTPATATLLTCTQLRHGRISPSSLSRGAARRGQPIGQHQQLGRDIFSAAS